MKELTGFADVGFGAGTIFGSANGYTVVGTKPQSVAVAR
jgi:hypothetical protein